LPEYNVLVLGLDDLNLDTLRDLPDAGDYWFHSLLSPEELLEAEHLDLRALLDKARRQIKDFDGEVHGIVGYWDFPVSSMVPILCAELDLPGARLEAVVKCEHKYWSRIEQQKVIDEHPRFGIVDIDGDAAVPPGLRCPLWLKPVKSASSELAFRAGDDREFTEAVEAIREGIDRIGQPFEFVLEQLDLPGEIAEVGGRACLAEEEVPGRQVTVEGYVFQGDVHVHGIVDSVTYPDSTSFLRFQYPSSVPSKVAERLEDLSRKVITQIGLDGSTFNIEYFWEPDSDALCLLEINPRHSQSHARLFENVDGVSNHQVMVQLGLGVEPTLPRDKGEYDIAAKWFLRRFSDGFVRRTPTAEEVEQIERDIPGVTVNIVAQEGERLSDLASQDSYSYELADIFVGGCDEDDLVAKYERCVEALRFDFDD
jgi:biotin carboxylase